MRSYLSGNTSDAKGSAAGAPGPLKRAVLLINLGTPEEPTVRAVRRYLREFLADPAVIQLPKGMGRMNRLLGRMIARFRAPKSAAMYRSVWTEKGSPLRVIANAQVAALWAAMPKGWQVFGAMRYGHPSIPDTLRAIEAAGIDELVIVPMYPQFSGATTGTALREVYSYLEGDDHPIQVTTRVSWYNDYGFISAQTELLRQYMRAHDLTPETTYLLFSTHGLPVSYVKKGDPYPEQVAQSVGLVGQRSGWPSHRMTLAYQSRLGPAAWLQPYTDELLENLVARGEKKILICPISFTTDCLETLEEIDIRYRNLVERLGGELYLCPAVNTFGPFISALKQLVLRGCRPISEQVRSVHVGSQTETDAVDHATDWEAFVMIGVSSPGRLGSGRGPELKHADGLGLQRVKRSACDIPELLRTIRREADVQESWLWNTCHRFEFYGWLSETGRHAGRAEQIREIRRHLFGSGSANNGEVNVLSGTEALHHLLRTAVGLNSALPGERDVLEQLHAAYRLADRAGAAGSVMRRLLDEASALEEALRDGTDWGRYHPEYAHIALLQVAREVNLDLAASRIVVFGGSTTSAGVLRTLSERFHVASRQMTLLYRGHRHGGHLKLLRKAIGNGRRIRVQTYAETAVWRAVADADVLIFGVDRNEPLVDAARLGACRGTERRPLTIIDFNTFASTSGMEDLEEVRLFPLPLLDARVRTYADEMCSSSAFHHAVDEAEAWVHQGVLGLTGAPTLMAQAEGPVDSLMFRTTPRAVFDETGMPDETPVIAQESNRS